MTNKLEQLKSFCEECINSTRQQVPYDTGFINAYREVIAQINTLLQPESDTMPFQFPVPDGWRVVTRVGMDIMKLTDFVTKNGKGYAGVLNGHLKTWYSDGQHYSDKPSDYDLVLRRIQPKTRTVWVVKKHIKNQYTLTGAWYNSSICAATVDNIDESNLIPVTIKLP